MKSMMSKYKVNTLPYSFLSSFMLCKSVSANRDVYFYQIADAAFGLAPGTPVVHVFTAQTRGAKPLSTSIPAFKAKYGGLIYQMLFFAYLTYFMHFSHGIAELCRRWDVSPSGCDGVSPSRAKPLLRLYLGSYSPMLWFVCVCLENTRW